MFCLNKYLLNHHGFFLDGNILNSQIYLWVGQFSLLTVYIGGVINIHILMCGINQLLPKVKCQKWSIKDWCLIHWMIDQLTRDTLPFLQKYFKIDFFSCFLNFFFFLISVALKNSSGPKSSSYHTLGTTKGDQTFGIHFYLINAEILPIIKVFLKRVKENS